GCETGLQTYAANYTKQYGSCTEAEYPYTARENRCRRCSSVLSTIGCAVLFTGDWNTTEILLQCLVAQEPVAVIVSANNDIWRNYQSGIVRDPSCYDGDVGHGVTIVGFNIAVPGQEYWIVKNSVGTSWGMNGYIYLGMGSNVCGLTKYPMVPLVYNPP